MRSRAVWARDRSASTLMALNGRHLPGRHLREEAWLRRALKIGVPALQVGLLVLALVVVGLPMVTGHEWRTVATGSMRPLIQPGDVVLASPMAAPPQVGDVVVFPDPITGNRDVIHRVIGYDEHGQLETKGDANERTDPWTLDPSSVTGSMTFRVPLVGSAVQLANTRLGIVIFLVLPALGLVISESRVWYRYVRYGAEDFETRKRARHRPGRGRHLEGALA